MIDWRQWQNEPGLVGAIAVVGWLYALGVGPLRTFWAPASPFPGRAACRFAGGLFLLWFAVASPFEQIGRYYLFSAQMCTQMLIVYPVAWLLLTGLPPGLLDWLLALLPGSRHWGRVLFRPLTCGAAFVLGVSIWYLPRIYESGSRARGRPRRGASPLPARRGPLLVAAGEPRHAAFRPCVSGPAWRIFSPRRWP